MIRFALLCALLLGCENARDRDCKIVRQMLSPDPNAAIHDLEFLRKTHWRDAQVKSAIADLLRTGSTFYTPNRDAHAQPTAKLRQLCGIE